ncbi:hypothetical protein GEMRC1_013344 [Eukaryota sp. GEM-RC1]
MTNAPELMGNYEIMGTFWIDCFAAFRRGVLIEGTGDLVVLKNQQATFAGNFILEGNVQVMEMASFDFLERATVRFFYSNYAEHGATIDWHSASRLQLQDLAVSITNGTYTVQSGAEWRPVTAFRGSLNLSGDSVFHFEPSIGVVDFDGVSVYENALLLLDSDQLFTVNSLQLGDGVSLRLPLISGSDDILVVNSFLWYSGGLENNIEISTTATATVDQFSLKNNATFGPDRILTVNGKLIIDGTLSLLTKSNLKLHSLVTITSQFPLLLWPDSQTLFSPTSSLTLSSTINSTISTSKQLPAFLSFQGSALLNSPLIIDTFVNSLFGSGSSFNLSDSYLQIDSYNDPLIGGTFTLFNDSFISGNHNELTFVTGSMVQGTGRLFPGLNNTITVNGNYHASPYIYKPQSNLIFENACIKNLSSIDATNGTFVIRSCTFDVENLVMSSINLTSVETIFSTFTTPMIVDQFSITDEYVLFENVGGENSLDINNFRYSGDVEILNIPGFITINNLLGLNHSFTLHNYDSYLTVGDVELTIVADLSISTLINNPVIKSMKMLDNSTSTISVIPTLNIPSLSTHNRSLLTLSSFDHFISTNFSMYNVSKVTVSDVSSSVTLDTTKVLDQSKLFVSQVSNVTLTMFTSGGSSEFTHLNGNCLFNTISVSGKLSITDLMGSLIGNTIVNSGTIDLNHVTSNIDVVTVTSSGVLQLNDTGGNLLVNTFLNSGHFVLSNLDNDFISNVFVSSNVSTINLISGDLVCGDFENSGNLIAHEVSKHISLTNLTNSGTLRFNSVGLNFTVQLLISTNSFHLLNVGQSVLISTLTTSGSFTVNTIELNFQADFTTSNALFSLSNVGQSVIIPMFFSSRRFTLTNVGSNLISKRIESSDRMDVTNIQGYFTSDVLSSSAQFFFNTIHSHVYVKSITTTSAMSFTNLFSSFTAHSITSSGAFSLSNLSGGI